MASETEIANLAAIRLGQPARILSLDDDRTVARTLKAVWAIERRAVLRDGSWNFAMRSEALPALSPAEHPAPSPWSYLFELPTDCLRLIEVQDSLARADYELQDRQIAAHVSGPLNIRFLADVAEMGRWDAAAAEAFALRLAWRCGPKIVGASFDGNGIWAEYRVAIAAARRVDAMENPAIPLDESDWIAARLGVRSGQ